jgi:hypothetical protein
VIRSRLSSERPEAEVHVEACQFFECLRAGGAPIASDGISSPGLLSNVKYDRCRNARGLGNASNRGGEGLRSFEKFGR